MLELIDSDKKSTERKPVKTSTLITWLVPLFLVWINLFVWEVNDFLASFPLLTDYLSLMVVKPMIYFSLSCLLFFTILLKFKFSTLQSILFALIFLFTFGLSKYLSSYLEGLFLTDLESVNSYSLIFKIFSVLLPTFLSTLFLHKVAHLTIKNSIAFAFIMLGIVLLYYTFELLYWMNINP